MNILIIHHRYRFPGGEERYVETLASMLERRGHGVVRFERSGGELDSFGSRVGGAVEMIGSHRSLRLLRESIGDDCPDVAHVNNLYPLISTSVLYELRRRRIPVVMSVHNHRLICPEGTCSRHGRPCELCCGGNYLWGIVNNCRGAWMESAAYGVILGLHRRRREIHRMIDRFVVPTAFLRGKLAAYGYPEDRMVVIPNMVEIPAPVAGSGERTVLSFGRLSRGKGLFTLIDAAARLPKIPFVVAGEGELRGGLETHCRKAGTANVRFAGRLDGDRLSSEIARAAFTLLPSECYENCPYAVLESLAAGRAVVASRIGALPEIVRDGETGLLFTPGDAADLAAKIGRLWDDAGSARRMGDAARKECAERFSADIYYARLMEVYGSLIDGLKK